MAKKDDGLELLRLACEKGLISEEELDRLLSEHLSESESGHGLSKSPTRLAMEKGMLSEESARDLETEAWIRRLPDEFDGYRLEGLLGRGGMATVFGAQDLSLGKIVAIKILLPEFAASETYLARFHREARIAARLTHPNTVQVFRAGEHAGLHYLVMEYIEGDTLSEVIRARGRIPEAEALEIIRQVCGALEEASDMGIVHRDIKPGNILMSKWGVPRLADFGIAKEISDISDPRIQMSLTMGVVGTPTYMSPEQARGARHVDFRSDIYSLGATLYHMIVGEVPHFADTPQETMVRVASEAPRPPRSLMPGLSEATGAVICKMMAKDPDNRYESFAALSADLEAARDEEEVSLEYSQAVRLLLPVRATGEEVDEEPEEPSSPLRIALIAAAVGAAGLLLALLLRSC